MMALAADTVDRKKLVRWLLLGAVISVSGVSGYLVLTAASGATDHLFSLPFQLLLACLTLALLNYFLRSVRWSMLCNKIDASAGFAHDSLYYLAGFPMGLTPGKVGDVVRLWLMQRGLGTPILKTAPLLIADRAYDLIALTLLVAFGAGMFADAIWPVVLLLAVVGGGALVMIGFPSIIRESINLAYRMVGRFPRIFVKLRQASESFESLASWKLGGASTFVSLVGWFSEVVILKLVADYFGAGLTIEQAGFIFSAGMVLGAFTFVPGGLGVADLSMIGIMTSLGVDLSTATAITIIVRACTLWFSILVGLVALPMGLNLASKEERKRSVPTATRIPLRSK